MFNKNYKRGASDAMEAYEAFAKRQESATRCVGEKIGKLSDDVTQLGENVAFISDYITDKEKQALYKANMPVDILGLDKTDKYLLVAILYELAQEEMTTVEQKNYIRAVQKYLNIREVQRDIDLSVVETISDSATTVAIMQVVMEYFYLGTHPGAYTEDELDLLDCFMANRRTRKEIMDRIQAIVGAVGKEGLAEKYGFVPEFDINHDTRRMATSTNYLPSTDVADKAPFLEENNGRMEILMNLFGFVIETDNYYTFASSLSSIPAQNINKHTGEIKFPFESDCNIDRCICCEGDSLVIVDSQLHYYVYEISNGASHLIPASGNFSPDFLCMSGKYVVYSKDSWSLHVTNYISGKSWAIMNENNQTINAESAFLVGDILYILETKDVNYDYTALLEYDLSEKKFKQIYKVDFDGRNGKILVHNQMLYVVTQYYQSDTGMGAWKKVFSAPVHDLKLVKEEASFPFEEIFYTRTGKIVHTNSLDRGELYVYDFPSNELIKIGHCSAYRTYVIGSFVYYMNGENCYRVSLSDMNCSKIAP